MRFGRLGRGPKGSFHLEFDAFASQARNPSFNARSSLDTRAKGDENRSNGVERLFDPALSRQTIFTDLHAPRLDHAPKGRTHVSPNPPIPSWLYAG